MNPVKRTFSFEHWYIVYFHDIQLWERKHDTGGASDDQASIYSNLVATTRRIARSSLGTTMSSLGSNDAQVIEVIERVVDMAKVGELVFFFWICCALTFENFRSTGFCWTSTA